MTTVTPQMEQHLKANMTISKKDLIISNFLGGLAWGLGTVIGATVIVAILGYILKMLGVFEFLGIFLNGLSNFGNTQQVMNQLPKI